MYLNPDGAQADTVDPVAALDHVIIAAAVLSSGVTISQRVLKVVVVTSKIHCDRVNEYS